MSKRKCIAVDLDGTLATYDRWPVDGSIGRPVAGLVERVKAALAAGIEVWVFTARVAVEPGFEDLIEQEERIYDWCEEHIGARLPVTAVKLRRFDEFWDDKAVRVDKNRGELPLHVRDTLFETVIDAVSWQRFIDEGGDR